MAEDLGLKKLNANASSMLGEYILQVSLDNDLIYEDIEDDIYNRLNSSGQLSEDQIGDEVVRIYTLEDNIDFIDNLRGFFQDLGIVDDYDYILKFSDYGGELPGSATDRYYGTKMDPIKIAGYLRNNYTSVEEDHVL